MSSISSIQDLNVAEKRMAALEEQLLSLESLSTKANDSRGVEEALRNYQLTILQRLKNIRDLMSTEKGSSESIAKVTEERDSALVENLKLKKEVERLNYRVNHLVKALNVEEAKH